MSANVLFPIAVKNTLTIGIAVGLVQFIQIFVRQKCPLKPTTQAVAMLVAVVATELFYACHANPDSSQALAVGLFLCCIAKMYTICEMNPHGDPTVSEQIGIAGVAHLASAAIVGIGYLLASVKL